MRTATIFSAAALLLSSFTTGLPFGSESIEARALTPAQKATYLSMKSLTTQAVNYENSAHQSCLGAMQQKDPALKASYQTAARAYYAKLCTMWTQIEQDRQTIAAVYGDNDAPHVAEIAMAGAKIKLYCTPPC